MLVGAFSAAAVAKATGDMALGLAAGTLAGLFLSSLVGGAALGLKADVFVAGLAANIFAPGIVSVVSQSAYGTKGSLRPKPFALETSRASPSSRARPAFSRSSFPGASSPCGCGRRERETRLPRPRGSRAVPTASPPI